MTTRTKDIHHCGEYRSPHRRVHISLKLFPSRCQPHPLISVTILHNVIDLVHNHFSVTILYCFWIIYKYKHLHDFSHRRYSPLSYVIVFISLKLFPSSCYCVHSFLWPFYMASWVLSNHHFLSPCISVSNNVQDPDFIRPSVPILSCCCNMIMHLLFQVGVEILVNSHSFPLSIRFIFWDPVLQH